MPARLTFLHRRIAPWLAALLLVACGGGGGGGTPEPLPNGDVPYTDAAAYSSRADGSLTAPNEGSALTHHTIVLDGASLDYTVRAGHLSARDAVTDAPLASFFYVAYTLPGRDPASRPLTFFYNGGPGSASVWLHLGSFGPKRLATGVPGTSAAVPFPLVDNAQTLLDTSDLVFVDAIGSGLSTAIAPRTNASFWGVDADAEVFRDFVMRYLAVNAREASPLFLFGESYGTTRTAVLAPLLEAAGAPLAGLVLQSSVLNYNSNCGVLGSQAVSCAGFLPTYSAAGAYHERVTPPAPDLDGFMAEMRAYTRSTYSPAVDALLGAQVQPPAGLPAELSELTGFPAERWAVEFNLGPGSFQSGLLPGELIGRYDARMSAPLGSPLAREGDPSSTFITASFASTIQSYLRGPLRYGYSAPYALLSEAIQFWDFSHDGQAVPDTIPDLATALAQNPDLRVLALNGYHDLATPFFQTEQDLERLGPLSSVRSLSYAGGHMTYLDDTSRPAEKAALSAFYADALAARSAAAAAARGASR